MNRTYAGYIFKCKSCGKHHLMDCNDEPYDGICLPCAEDSNVFNIYEETDFTFWHGMHWDMFEMIVQEIKR